jgi:fucose permease
LVSPALATELTPVSILFFLWGFAKGLIGALSMDIQKLLGYSPPHSIALHNAYWAAYFFGPLLVGYWVLKYHGFKATFITGLAIYAAGAMAFVISVALVRRLLHLQFHRRLRPLLC